MRWCVWLLAQLLDGKSFHRHKNTVDYFSPSRLRNVCTFAERQQGGLNTRTRVRIRGHAKRGDRRKFPRVAWPPRLARAHVFHPANLARAKSANGGTGEDIVIRSRITCSLNDLTWHRYDRKHIEEHLQVCNCCSSKTFFFLFVRQCFVYWSSRRLPESGTSSEHSRLAILAILM